MFYISTGDQTKMYTLRETFQDTVWFHGENGNPTSQEIVRDYYIRNLSTDKSTAIAKAKELGYTVSNPDFDLQEIKRRNAEQMELARKAQEEKEKQLRTSSKAAQLRKITDALEGFMPIGKGTGKPIEKLIAIEGVSYALYWLKQAEKQDADSVVKAIASFIDRIRPDIREFLIDKQNGNGEHFGEVKKRYKGKELTLIASFQFEGFYGYTYVEKYLCDGALVVYKGARPIDLKLLESGEVDFSVKEHTEYKGVPQTIIQRLKLNN